MGIDGLGIYIGCGLCVMKYYFFGSLGRLNVLKIFVLVVVGKLVDDVIVFFLVLRLYGVEIFCIGVGNFYSKL